MIKKILIGLTMLSIIIVVSAASGNHTVTLRLQPFQITKGTYGPGSFEGFSPEQLIDSNKGNQYAAYSNATGLAGMYIQVDLNRAYKLQSVIIHSRKYPDDLDEPYYFIDEAALELSVDGDRFHETDRKLTGINPCKSNKGKEEIVLQAYGNTASIIRINILNTTASLAAQISEIEVIAAEDTAQDIGMKDSLASSTDKQELSACIGSPIWWTSLLHKQAQTAFDEQCCQTKKGRIEAEIFYTS